MFLKGIFNLCIFTPLAKSKLFPIAFTSIFFSISLFSALYEYLSGFDEAPKTKVFFTILS